MYNIKHKAIGSIERYKAGLVAKQYYQIEWLNFFDTFSPIAKLSTIRLLLDVSSLKNWHLHQVDVNHAFLHDDINEDVNMEVLKGVMCNKDYQVCRLRKSLNGLKQASSKRYENMTTLLLVNGYKQSNSDYSLFTHEKDELFTMLLVYVDDVS